LNSVVSYADPLHKRGVEKRQGRMLLLLLLFMTGRCDGRESPPYCFMDGCATASVCQCFWFFTSCNIDTVDEGTCQFTTPGIIALVVISLVAIVLLILLIGSLACCGICFKGCCKKDKDKGQPLHTTVNYYPMAPPIPHPDYPQYNQL